MYPLHYVVSYRIFQRTTENTRLVLDGVIMLANSVVHATAWQAVHAAKNTTTHCNQSTADIHMHIAAIKPGAGYIITSKVLLFQQGAAAAVFHPGMATAANKLDGKDIASDMEAACGGSGGSGATTCSSAAGGCPAHVPPQHAHLFTTPTDLVCPIS
jgi:hypothetical protein